jgi:hypothetical protein
MKLETLRELIKKIPITSQEGDIINLVLDLIDLYEQDNKQSANPIPPSFPIPRSNDWSPFKSIPIPHRPNTDNDMVTYGEICSCNPKNGGSGICGCVIGNKLVPRSSNKASSSFPPQD